MEKHIGQVTHYYRRISVAVLELSGGLKVGDVVHIRGHTTDFTQEVESMEIEHQKVHSVGPGADVALKVIEHARKGDAVYKVVEEEAAAGFRGGTQ
jgi:translation elongation factor EF-1alpha